MALNKFVSLAEAIGEMASVMVKEESIKATGITIPNTKFSRDDLEYLSSVITKELPVTVGYYTKCDCVVVTFTRKSVCND